MIFSNTEDYIGMTLIEKDRVLKAEEICEKLSISKSIIKFAYDESISRKENYYHNFQHLLTVAINTYKGAVHYNIFSLPLKQALFIAGLFHDIKYDIRLHESVNIKTAIDFINNTLPNYNFIDNRSVYYLAEDLV